MNIDELVSGLKEDYVVYENNKFRLSNGKYFHTLYFREKNNDSKQLKLFSDDYLNSLRVDKYE